MQLKKVDLIHEFKHFIINFGRKHPVVYDVLRLPLDSKIWRRDWFRLYKKK